MAACLPYMNQFLPVERMFLQLNEPSLGVMRTIATATKDGGKKVDLLTPLSKASRDRIRRRAAGEPEDTVVIDSEVKSPIAVDMLRFHDVQGSSVLRMRLLTGSGQIGAIVLTAEGMDRYTNEHIRLLRHLREPFTIAMSNALKHREVLKIKDLLADDNRYLQGELHRMSGDAIIGANFGLKQVMGNVQQVAALDSPVLLLGETGTGKDVIANMIHYSSARSDGPFVSVNCGAIPDSLIDSELFGHEKGAFTGALSQKRGRFERADRGTIFLDEIGELPPAAQVRLLRVLQSREIERVGGVKTIPLDIRIIAATNRNLEEMVRNKRFREDL